MNVTVVYCPHPFLPEAGRKTVRCHFDCATTVLEAILEAVPEATHKQHIRHNDVFMDSVAAADTFVSDGDIIACVTAVEGGGDSDPLRALLTIAVLVYAPQLAPAAWGTAGQLLVTAAGMWLVDAIAPVRMQDMSNAGGRPPSPTYSLSGGRNSMRPGRAKPLVYGTMRMAPDLDSWPFTEFEGDEAFLYQTFCFGVSDIDISDIKIGDTPIENFAGVEWVLSGPDGKLPGWSNVDSESVSATLEPGAPFLVRTTSTDTTEIAVDIAGQLFSTSDNGSYRRQLVSIGIEYRKVGDTNWLPFAAVGLLQQHATFWSAGYSYSSTREWGRNGNSETTHHYHQVAYGSTDPADHTHGDVYTGGGSYSKPVTWKMRSFGSALTQRHPAPLREYRTAAGSVVIENDTPDPIRRTYRIKVAQGQYELRVKRDTGATGIKNIVNVSWTGLKSYQPDPTDYTGNRRLWVKIRASGQLNNAIDELTAEVRARVPVRETDGTWGDHYSSNPAWQILDFARGKRLNGRRIYGCDFPDDMINFEQIYVFADFCYLHDLRCDIVLDQDQSCAKILDLISTCGRGSRSWGTGKFGVVWDDPSHPVTASFGMHNIVAGTFGVDWISDGLPSEVEVVYRDRFADYKERTLRAPVPNVVDNGSNPSSIELMGVTREVQAKKEANLLAASLWYRNRSISWETEAEGLAVTRGDVVKLSHDLTRWAKSGRLLPGTTDTLLKLNRVLTMEAATDYWVAVVRPDGVEETRQCQLVVGEVEELILITPLPWDPAADTESSVQDYAWRFAPTPTPGWRAMIKSIQPASLHRVKITAVDDPAEYHASVDNPVVLPPALPYFAQRPRILSVQITEQLIDLSNNVRVTLTVDLLNAAGMRVKYAVNARPVIDTGIVNGARFSVDAMQGDTIAFDLRAWSIAKLAVDQPNTQITHMVAGELLPPATPKNFVVTRQGDELTFRWTQVAELDVLTGGGYRLYRGAALASAVRIGETIDTTYRLASAQPGTYLLVSVDRGGRQSIPAVAQIQSGVDINIVVTHDEGEGGWNGVHTGTVETAQALELESTVAVADLTETYATYTRSYLALSPVVASGVYESEVSDLGRIITARVEIDYLLEQIQLGTTVADWTQPYSFYSSGWTYQGPDGVASLDIRVRSSEDNITWTDWDSFSPGEKTFQFIQFELTLASADPSNYSARAEFFRVIVDVPDREILIEDETIPIGGKRITFTPEFIISPVVLADLQDAATGDAVKLSNKTIDGVDVTVVNSAGISIAGNIDLRARAY